MHLKLRSRINIFGINFLWRREIHGAILFFTLPQRNKERKGTQRNTFAPLLPLRLKKISLRSSASQSPLRLKNLSAFLCASSTSATSSKKKRDEIFTTLSIYDPFAKIRVIFYRSGAAYAAFSQRFLLFFASSFLRLGCFIINS